MKIGKLRLIFLTFLTSVISFSGIAIANEPLPWQMGLQPPAGSISVMANDLHNLLLVVITAISVFVLFLLVYVFISPKPNTNIN